MAIEPPDPAKTWRYSATANPPKKAPQRRKPRRTKVNHFMRLPAELRNNIYELVLVDNTKPQQIRHSKRKDPALLRTCKQIRLEARAIYYCLNEFSLIVPVENLELLNQWLQYIKLTCGKISGSLCVMECTLDDVGKLLPLLQIMHEGMDIMMAADVRTVSNERTKFNTSTLWPDHQSGLEMLAILPDLKRLGDKAKSDEWDTGRAEVEFDKFMLETLANGSPHRPIRKARLMIGEPTGPVDSKPTNMPWLDNLVFQADREDSPDLIDRKDDESSEDEGRRHKSGWTVVN